MELEFDEVLLDEAVLFAAPTVTVELS